MSTHPTMDESGDRLHRTGWSAGEIATATRGLVNDTNGGTPSARCLRES
jgi:hypothetical protein